jgi:hypothetical protein
VNPTSATSIAATACFGVERYGGLRIHGEVEEIRERLVHREIKRSRRLLEPLISL